MLRTPFTSGDNSAIDSGVIGWYHVVSSDCLGQECTVNSGFMVQSLQSPTVGGSSVNRILIILV